MDVYFASFIPQLLALAFIVFFLMLSYRKPLLAALTIPVIFPLYLVKLYFRPGLTIGCFSDSYKECDSFFSDVFVPSSPGGLAIRPDFGPQTHFVIPTNLLEILLLVFLVINFASIIHGIKQVWQEKIGKYLIFFILALLFSVLISTIYSINLRVSLGAAKSWFFLPVILFFALLPWMRSPEFRQKFLYSMALSGVFITLTSLPFLLTGSFTYDGRLAGIFLSPNHLAMALVPGLLAIIILVTSHYHGNPKSQTQTRSNKIPDSKLQFGFRVWDFICHLDFRFENFRKVSHGKLPYALLLMILVIESIILYLTYSYGTWIGITTAVLFLLIWDLRFYCKVGFGTWKLLILLFLVIIAISQIDNPKLLNIIQGNYYSSLHSRLMIWQSALAISRDHWFTGVGADNFQQAYLEYQSQFPEPYIEWSAPQPHNVFLAFLTQLGIIGLISFISIISLTFLEENKRGSFSQNDKKRNGGLKIVNCKLNENCKLKIENLDSLSLWVFSYLIYIIIHGLVDTPYMKNDLAILFWLALAAIWAAKSTHTTDYASQDKQTQ